MSHLGIQRARHVQPFIRAEDKVLWEVSRLIMLTLLLDLSSSSRGIFARGAGVLERTCLDSAECTFFLGNLGGTRMQKQREKRDKIDVVEQNAGFLSSLIFIF